MLLWLTSKEEDCWVKTGADARILEHGDNDISVSIISQGSSGIMELSLVVAAIKATKPRPNWKKEFENDFYSKDVNKITVVDNVSVILIIGRKI
jgi:hypothetical protein